MQVTFVYTDGRNRPDYKIEIGAERVQAMLMAGSPIEVVAGQDELDAWCEANGVEPYVAPEKPPVEPEKGEAPIGVLDGWPDGTEWERRGAWYSGTTPNGETFKVLGKAAAQESARKLMGGDSDDAE